MPEITYNHSHIHDFNGDDPSTLGQFIADLDQAKIEGNLSNEQVATIAERKLPPGSTAKNFLSVLKFKGKAENLDIWDSVNLGQGNAGNKPGGLKKALLEQFSPKKNFRHIAQLVQQNIQQPGEKVKAFYFRLEKNRLLAAEQAHGKEKLTQNKTIFLEFHENLVIVDFINGVRPLMRQSFAGKDIDNSETLLSLAQSFEDSDAGQKELESSKNKSATAASLTDSSTKSATQPHTRPSARRRYEGYCAYCGMKDSHGADECYTRNNDRNAGYFADRCRGYPLTSRKEKNKLKKERENKKKEQEKAALAAAAAPNSSQQLTNPSPLPLTSHPSPGHQLLQPTPQVNSLTPASAFSLYPGGWPLPSQVQGPPTAAPFNYSHFGPQLEDQPRLGQH